MTEGVAADIGGGCPGYTAPACCGGYVLNEGKALLTGVEN